MSYLLDTHALIWSLTEPERLSKRVDCLETARFYDRNFTAGDPFDRLLCHISVERGLTLITRDPFFEKVKIEGFQYFW